MTNDADEDRRPVLELLEALAGYLEFEVGEHEKSRQLVRAQSNDIRRLIHAMADSTLSSLANISQELAAALAAEQDVSTKIDALVAEIAAQGSAVPQSVVDAVAAVQTAADAMSSSSSALQAKADAATPSS